MIKLISGILLLIGFSGNVFASDYMSAEEVKALLTDKTFDGEVVVKNKVFSVYAAPDGKHFVKRPNGKVEEWTWFVNDKGQHCVINPRWTKPAWKKGRCTNVKDAGNGKYFKINDNGEHTHTIKNFRDGRDL